MKNNQGNNRTFDKFKSKLTIEAVLKSALLGLSIGLFVGGIIALICWLCGFKMGIWIAVGVGAGAAAISIPLFYFLKFRPSVIQTCRRVDALGLQERVVTMYEHMGDESYMATRQRADAKSRIDRVNARTMKMSMPGWLVGLFSGAAVFGITFTIVCALFISAIIPSPSISADARENFIEVTYVAEDGGEIVGETDQILEYSGANATTVTAVAMDGYMFIGWDDGNNNPSRTDLNVTENLFVTARFDLIEDGDGAEDGDFDGPAEGDEAPDQPTDGEGNGQGGEGDGNGASGDNEGTGSGEDKGDGKGDGQGDGAGGKWGEGNQIIDGNTYYRDKLDEYYQEAMNDLLSRDDIPPELREFIEDYYGSV